MKRCTAINILIILLAATFMLAGCDNIGRPKETKPLSLSEALGGELTGKFESVHRERKFNFPHDHAAHKDYRHEWWYFSGNVQSLKGHRFGYELTFFRIALNSPDTLAVLANSRVQSSSWRANNVYLAHLAVTDIDNNKFYYTEKFSRD